MASEYITLSRNSSHEMISTYSENTDARSPKSPIQFSEYQKVLNMLADNDSINLTFNYTLEETIRLMENLSKEDIKNNENVKSFVYKAAIHLSDYQWIYFEKSTASNAARLELLLRAMSSVLHIVSQSVLMIESNTRTSLYKSVSKFWAVYRNTKCINANIMFTLREIRTCLRKIKDDRSNADHAVRIGSNLFDVVVSVVQKEYLAAFGAFINTLDFEYSAGTWYNKWTPKHEKYFILRQKYLKNDDTDDTETIEEIEAIKKFYRKLYKSSVREYRKVKRKNTKYRNFEYKLLKSGSIITRCSLPDHIDTLLIGYLDLIQRLLKEFFTQVKDFVTEIILFCNEIIRDYIKKQLMFKAVETLHVIKESDVDEEIKKEIEWNFENRFNTSTFMTPPPSTDFNNSSSQLYIPPDTPASPTSAYTSLSTPPQSPILPLSHEENKKQQRKLNVREITFLSDFQKYRQQKLFSTREQIIDDVINLFKERHNIEDNINEIKAEYNELLDDEAVNKDSCLFLSKLKEILDEKRKQEADKKIEIDEKLKEVLEEKREPVAEEKGEEILINEADKKVEIDKKLKEVLEEKREPVAEEKNEEIQINEADKKIEIDKKLKEVLEEKREPVAEEKNEEIQINEANKKIEIDKKLKVLEERREPVAEEKGEDIQINEVDKKIEIDKKGNNQESIKTEEIRDALFVTNEEVEEVKIEIDKKGDNPERIKPPETNEEVEEIKTEIDKKVNNPKSINSEEIHDVPLEVETEIDKKVNNPESIKSPETNEKVEEVRMEIDKEVNNPESIKSEEKPEKILSEKINNKGSDDGDSVHSSLSEEEYGEGNSQNNKKNNIKIIVNNINIDHSGTRDANQPDDNIDNIEDPQYLKVLRKIIKEVGEIVDKASKAHKAASIRSLSNNSSRVSVSEIDEGEKVKEVEINEKEVGRKEAEVIETKKEIEA